MELKEQIGWSAVIAAQISSFTYILGHALMPAKFFPQLDAISFAFLLVTAGLIGLFAIFIAKDKDDGLVI